MTQKSLFNKHAKRMYSCTFNQLKTSNAQNAVIIAAKKAFFKENEGKLFARKDSATGLPIDQGYCFGNGEYYCESKEDAVKYAKKLGYKSLKEAYDDDTYYWTTWEDDECQYIVRNGKLIDIEDDDKGYTIGTTYSSGENWRLTNSQYDAFEKYMIKELGEGWKKHEDANETARDYLHRNFEPDEDTPGQDGPFEVIKN